MGTINYGSNDYICIGLNPNNWNWCQDDFETYEEWDHQKQFEMEADYENTKSILDDYSFNYFKVTLENGYYEGFYLNIETYFPFCLDTYLERKDINTEVNQIKELLIKLVNEVGLCEVWPGWCPKYMDRDRTLKSINKAIAKLRRDSKKVPTYTTWSKLPDNLKWV